MSPPGAPAVRLEGATEKIVTSSEELARVAWRTSAGFSGPSVFQGAGGRPADPGRERERERGILIMLLAF